MNLVLILRYLPHILKFISLVSEYIKGMESDKERKEFAKKIEVAFEKSKAGDTSNIEQLLNGKDT